MELYDAIFYRKTIKSYSNKKIKEPLLKEINRICSNITYLNKDLNIKAHLIERGHLIHFLVGKDTEVKSPHYILLTSNKGEDYLQNVGFAAEGIVLDLVRLGIGTTWLKCNLKRDDIKTFVQLEEIDTEDEEDEDDSENIEDKKEYPVSLIAIGYPDKYDSLFRKSKKSYDRKNMKHVCEKFSDKWKNVFEAVRVSPSMMNKQPWVFVNQEYGFDLYEILPKRRLKIERENKISMGVALRHLDICCKKENLELEYIKKNIKSKRRKEYFISIVDAKAHEKINSSQKE